MRPLCAAAATSATACFTTGNAKVAEAGKVPAAYLKWQITTQMCMVTGGPCKYTGRDMKESHKNLGITEAEWTSAVADLVSALDAHKVPQAEKDELLKILGTAIRGGRSHFKGRSTRSRAAGDGLPEPGTGYFAFRSP